MSNTYGYGANPMRDNIAHTMLGGGVQQALNNIQNPPPQTFPPQQVRLPGVGMPGSPAPQPAATPGAQAPQGLQGPPGTASGPGMEAPGGLVLPGVQQPGQLPPSMNPANVLGSGVLSPVAGGAAPPLPMPPRY